MKTRIGMFVTSTEDGRTVTDKVFKYSTYQEMLNDTDHGKYGIVGNTVYNNENGAWVIGFSNIERSGEYTAFNVYPHLNDIPVGENDELGNIVEAVPANTLHRIQIRTGQYDYTKSDVVIDWGDGSCSSIAAGQFNTSGIVNKLSDEPAYIFEHDYAEALASNGKSAMKFTVKIYGKDYYGLMHRINGLKKETSNLVCDAMSDDLPVADHVKNLVGYLFNARCLTKINLWNHQYKFIEHCQYMLAECPNLQSAMGFERGYTRSNCSFMFYNDYNLVESDAQIALASLRKSSITSMYENCKELSVDIATLIPEVIQCLGPYNVKKAFYNCKKIYGTVPANLLWNNTKREWGTTADCFTLCSPEIASQVPASWGGTLTE